MFVKMESSANITSRWLAKVFLRKNYQFVPHNPCEWDKNYPQWQQKSPANEVLFCQTEEPGQLGRIIHGAQLAILNPGVEQNHFIPDSLEEVLEDNRQAEFSPNIVCVYIWAPEIPSLSFYDLPGVIIARGNKDKESLKKL